MIGDVLERVEAAREALDGIKKTLKRPEANRLPGIPLARLAVNLDRAAAQLVKQAAAVALALENISRGKPATNQP